MKLNKIKNGIKKIAAVTTSGLMLGGTFTAVLAATTLDQVAMAGGPFIDSNGDFNANIVLGTGGATNVAGFAEDVAGAIEAGGAFLQKATATGAGQAVLSTSAWEGTNQTAVLGAGPTSVMTLDFQNVSSFAAYEWDESGTKKYANQTFRFETSINSTSDMKLNFPIGSLNLTLSLQGDTWNDTGDFMKIGETVYKVTDIWDRGGTEGFNVSVGRTSGDVRFDVGDSNTYAGVTVKLLGVDSSSGNAQLEFSGDSALGVVTTVKQQGSSYTYGTATITVDTTWGGDAPYALLDIVYDKQIMRDGEVFFGDANYNITVRDDGTLNNNMTTRIELTNNKILTLSAGESFSGPLDLFNISFIDFSNVASNDAGTEFQNITFMDSVALVNTFGCTLNEYINLTTDNTIIMPGIAYYNYTASNNEITSGKVADTASTFTYNTGTSIATLGHELIAFQGGNKDDNSRQFRLTCLDEVISVYNWTGSWQIIPSGENVTTAQGLFINNSAGTVSIRAPAIRWTVDKDFGLGNTTFYGRQGTSSIVTNTSANAVIDGGKLQLAGGFAPNPTFLNVSWDGSTSSSTGTLTITEPDGATNTITVTFNTTGDLRTYEANITAWSFTPGSKTGYGTMPFWRNETVEGGFDAGASNITDAINVTLKVPQKKLRFGTGSLGASTITLSIDQVHNFTTATDVTLASVAGGINEKAPTYAKLDSESGVTDIAVILVGGPAVNSHVKTLADAGSTWASSDYAEDRALIDFVEDAFGTGNHALILAGYAGKDTRLAAKVLASEILFPSAVAVDFTDKARVVLDTSGVTTYTGVTEVATATA